MFGLSIGIVFLTVFLKNKSKETGVSFCYFPNCRTLKDFRSKPLHFSDEIKNMMANKEIDSVSLTSFFYDGDVNFGRSSTKTVPCKIYFINGKVKEKDAVLKVVNCVKKVTISSIEY